ncbi:UDP-N-acetylglucosamine--N-acetylmuramyl-(pentapeptide) pyrophosphoryl-undecaprenol N-acetylglucosamine transferase [Synergistaceae bacterium OttesenSCG-928-I11]|nr:UDP-N-acetylglucosamine--N-acetylmuramyl-(pentapeptide) pyrophosphoryl-undecaprenol N-acetylglucosamine transferase [Synergistaceae bacterium OttesenSCG-928-I11]
MRERLLLVAGGTGGHIFPALSFGAWLSEAHPEVDVAYMCGSREMERDIYRSAGVEPFVLSASGSPLGAPKGRKISRFRELFASFGEAKRYLRDFSPEMCVTFGGYVSAPVLLFARIGKRRVIAHEQNAYAGRITRLAAHIGVPVASGWEECEPLKRGTYTHTGIPVRRFRRMEKRDAWRELGIPAEMSGCPTVLAMTGSLGSDSIRSVLSSACRDEKMRGWAFLVVGADGDVPERLAGNLFLLPKRWDASPFFSAADIAITRGGASTLSEVAVMDLPGIVIPWRGAVSDHQMKNARCFAADPRHAIWDEKTEQIDDLVKKLNDLYRSFPVKPGAIDKKMYNAAENACEQLWNLLISFKKGEIHVEGR